MIKIENGEIDLEGRAPELLTELGFAACEIITGMMQYDGFTKEKAIKMTYKALQVSIESYESNGFL